MLAAHAVCLVAALAPLCQGNEADTEYSTTGVIRRVSLEPAANCPSLFPVPGDECSNCTFEFRVSKYVNASEQLEQYGVATTPAARGNCTCPEGLSDWLDFNDALSEDVVLVFGDGVTALLSSYNGTIELSSNYSQGVLCTGVYEVTEGTVLNVTAPTTSDIPSSPEVDAFVVFLLLLSTVSILVVFMLAWWSQDSARSGYERIAG